MFGFLAAVATVVGTAAALIAAVLAIAACLYAGWYLLNH